jgi:hypothetical protein
MLAGNHPPCMCGLVLLLLPLQLIQWVSVALFVWPCCVVLPSCTNGPEGVLTVLFVCSKAFELQIMYSVPASCCGTGFAAWLVCVLYQQQQVCGGCTTCCASCECTLVLC